MKKVLSWFKNNENQKNSYNLVLFILLVLIPALMFITDIIFGTHAFSLKNSYFVSVLWAWAIYFSITILVSINSPNCLDPSVLFKNLKTSLKGMFTSVKFFFDLIFKKSIK